MEPAEGLPESVRDKLLVHVFHKKTTTKKVMVFGAGGGTSRKCSG